MSATINTTFCRQAITTKYIGPTNYRGSRVKATASAGSVTLEWDDELNTSANHASVAQALCNKFGWTGEYVMGGTETGYVFFYVGERP